MKSWISKVPTVTYEKLLALFAQHVIPSSPWSNGVEYNADNGRYYFPHTFNGERAHECFRDPGWVVKSLDQLKKNKHINNADWQKYRSQILNASK